MLITFDHCNTIMTTRGFLLRIINENKVCKYKNIKIRKNYFGLPSLNVLYFAAVESSMPEAAVADLLGDQGDITPTPLTVQHLPPEHTVRLPIAVHAGTPSPLPALQPHVLPQAPVPAMKPPAPPLAIDGDLTSRPAIPAGLPVVGGTAAPGGMTILSQHGGIEPSTVANQMVNHQRSDMTSENHVTLNHQELNGAMASHIPPMYMIDSAMPPVYTMVLEAVKT